MSTTTYTASMSQQTHTYSTNGIYTAKLDDAIFSLTLGSTSFANSKALKYIKTGSQVSSLATQSFRFAENLVCADLLSVSKIQTHTFYGCNSLLSANLPQLTSITLGTQSISGCYNLESIYVNSSTHKSLPLNGLNNQIVKNSNGTNLYFVCPTARGNFTDSSISSMLFYSFVNSEISSVNLPSFTVGGTRSFASGFRDSKLVSAEFAALTGTTSTYAFSNCSYLQYVKFNNITAFGNYTFQNCTKLSVIDMSERTSTSIPSITTYALTGCSNVSVIVPDSLYSSWIADSSWSALNGSVVQITKSSDFSKEDFLKNLDLNITYRHFSCSIDIFSEMGTFTLERVGPHTYRTPKFFDWDTYTWKNTRSECVNPQYDEITFDTSLFKWVWNEYYDDAQTGASTIPLYFSHEFPTMNIFDCQSRSFTQPGLADGDQTMTFQYVL